jgi:CheY-like chemotaxis protein
MGKALTDPGLGHDEVGEQRVASSIQTANGARRRRSGEDIDTCDGWSLVGGTKLHHCPLAPDCPFIDPFIDRLLHMPASEPRMVVLVVEDQTLVRMFMTDFLDEAGFKVFEAVNADEALTVLEARPDVQAVVTDIEMPGSMNGLVLAKVIQERWPGVGVVISSGRSRPGPDDLSEKVAFLAKPYLPDTVINVIRQMATPQVVEAVSAHVA